MNSATGVAAPVMVTLLVDLILTTSVCLAVAQLHGSAHLAPGARLREATRGPLRNPHPWPIGLGARFSALGSAARAAGAPLTSFELMVLTLGAALPSASNVSLLAERFHADTGRVARIILASTVLAFFSFSGLATWLGASSG